MYLPGPLVDALVDSPVLEVDVLRAAFGQHHQSAADSPLGGGGVPKELLRELSDADGRFAQRCNPTHVALERLLSSAEQADSIPSAIWHRGETDEAQLRRAIESHHRWTGSLRARELLRDWDMARTRIVKVFPHEYRRALGDVAARRATAVQLERASSEAH